MTTAVALLFVLGTGAVREAVEDYGRHKSDAEANAAPARRFSVHHGFVEVTTADLHVGDIVRVDGNETFPADVVLLGCASGATPYVMTANLDGETSLKQRRVPPVTATCTPGQLAQLSATVTVEAPNRHIHRFTGVLRTPNGAECVLSIKELLLRGSQLRGVPHVVGVVVYTGRDTRLAQNQLQPPARFSTVERMLNRFLIGLVAFQLLCCVGLSAAAVQWTGDSPWYIRRDVSNDVALFFSRMASFFILFALLIPLSLFVTLELVRFIQALLMRWDHVDAQPWDSGSTRGTWLARTLNGPPSGIRPRTSSLNEDLGLIQVVCSDKTGTLTTNNLQFAQCCVGHTMVDELRAPGSLRRAVAAAPPTSDVHDFLRLLAVCNSAVPERAHGRVTYTSESSDEVALALAAADAGVQLHARDAATAVIRTAASESNDVLQVLAAFDFTAARRRQSVVVRLPTGRTVLYAKGADVTLFERLAPGQDAVVERYRDVLEQWAARGLRTLVMARRELSDAECATLSDAYSTARKTLDASSQDEALACVAESMERNLTLVGCTAIQDDLQELYVGLCVCVCVCVCLFVCLFWPSSPCCPIVSVPETLAALRAAGINVWVLTGDKPTTALSIGRSSQLVPPGMPVAQLSTPKQDAADDACARLLEQAEVYANVPVNRAPSDSTSVLSPLRKAVDAKHALDAARINSSATPNPGAGFCLTLEGVLLDRLLQCDGARFAQLAKRASCVIVARATPLQKATVVQLLQHRLGRTTLAIGDGANDVAMLQAAHVGVGILGRDGTQAARSADYAISRFQNLQRLLFVSGKTGACVPCVPGRLLCVSRTLRVVL